MNLSRADELSIWQARLNAGMSVIENELRPEWLERYKNWRSEYWLDDPTPGHKVSVNMVRGIVSLMQAALYFSDPRVVVGAKKPNLGRAPQLAEALFNHYLEELRVGEQVKRCIKDALLFDAGYLKLGYEIEPGTDLEVITNEYDEEMVDGEGNALLKDPQGNLYVQKGGRFIQIMDASGELVEQEQEQPTINEFIRREQPFAIRWAPWDFLRDPRGKYADLSDATWIAFRAVLPLHEVKDNPTYENTRDLQGGLIARKDLLTAYDMFGGGKKDPELDCVEIFEIYCKEWNRKKRRYDIYQKVIATGHDKFLLHRLDPNLVDTWPCAVLAFDEDPSGGLEDEPHACVGRGSTPLRAIDSQIESLNISRAQMVTMQDQQIQRTVYNKQAVTDKEAQAFAELPPGGFIGLQNWPVEQSVANAFQPVPVPQIPPDIRTSYDLANDEIQKVLGVTDYQMGGGGGPKRQATEAGLIQSGYTVRVEAHRQAVGKMISDAVNFWAMVLRQWGDYETFVRITGDMGQEEFVQFKIGDVISNDLAIRIDTYQSVFQARDVQVKQAQDNLNVMAPLAQVYPINVMKLLEDLLRAQGKDIGPYLSQQPPMMPGMQPGMQPGMNGGSPFESLQRSGQVMDVNQLREPAAIGAGSTGRAIG